MRGRFMVVVVALFSLALAVIGAQQSAPASATDGVRIVMRSEMVPIPPVTKETLAAVANRRAAMPPDGVSRQTLLLKGSGFRLESSGPGPRHAYIRDPEGRKTYLVNLDEQIFTPMLDESHTQNKVDEKPTGAVEAIAGLEAHEVRFRLDRQLVRQTFTPSPGPASRLNTQGDGRTDQGAATGRWTNGLGMVALEPRTFGVTEGTAWFIDLPPVVHPSALRQLSALWLMDAPAAGNRFPARLTTRTIVPRSRISSESVRTVESLEVVPLADELFRVPKGCTEAPYRQVAASLRAPQTR